MRPSTFLLLITGVALVLALFRFHAEGQPKSSAISETPPVTFDASSNPGAAREASTDKPSRR